MSSVLEILFAWKSLFICSTCATSGETRSEHGKAPSGHDGAKILGGHARARLQVPPTSSLKASETWLEAAAARSDMNRCSSSGSMPDAVSTTCSPPRTSGGRDGAKVKAKVGVYSSAPRSCAHASRAAATGAARPPPGRLPHHYLGPVSPLPFPIHSHY
jgi:hypothetical protein